MFHPTLNMTLNTYCICPITFFNFSLPMQCLTSFSRFSFISEWIALVLSVSPGHLFLAFTVVDSMWLATSTVFYRFSLNSNCLNIYGIVFHGILTVPSDFISMLACSWYKVIIYLWVCFLLYVDWFRVFQLSFMLLPGFTFLII